MYGKCKVIKSSLEVLKISAINQTQWQLDFHMQKAGLMTTTLTSKLMC